MVAPPTTTESLSTSLSCTKLIDHKCFTFEHRIKDTPCESIGTVMSSQKKQNTYEDALQVSGLYIIYTYSYYIFISYYHINESISPSTFILRNSKGTSFMWHEPRLPHQKLPFLRCEAHHPAQSFGRSILNASRGWRFPYPESRGWWVGSRKKLRGSWS